MTRICFVRHGETDWNIQMRLQGQADRPLNAVGEAQALAVGRRFVGERTDALYSSDLLRVRQTAQPIADALQRPMVLLPAFRERNFGRCEGLTIEEISARYADDARAIQFCDPDYVLPDGESRRQHGTRILDGIAQLVSDHPEQTIVLVTHGGTLDVIFRRAHGLPLDAPRDYPIPNAGINWLLIDGERWVIETWADATHLD